jgi:hypothetical protein
MTGLDGTGRQRRPWGVIDARAALRLEGRGVQHENDRGGIELTTLSLGIASGNCAQAETV